MLLLLLAGIYVYEIRKSQKKTTFNGNNHLSYLVLANLVPRLLADFNGEVSLFNPAKTNTLSDVHV